MIDTPALQLIIDEAVGAGIERVVVVTSHAKPAIEAYFADAPEVVAKLRSTGRHEVADHLERIGRDVEVIFVQRFGAHPEVEEHRAEVFGGLGCELSGGPECPHGGNGGFEWLRGDRLGGPGGPFDELGSGCDLGDQPDLVGPLDEHGVVRIRTMVEKPPVAEAPSDLIIIGRYVLTPDVFEKIGRVQPGAGGEIQLTDALRMQAAEGPFHGVLSDIRRFDTGNPLGWLTAVVEMALEDERIGVPFRAWLRGRV